MEKPKSNRKSLELDEKEIDEVVNEAVEEVAIGTNGDTNNILPDPNDFMSKLFIMGYDSLSRIPGSFCTPTNDTTKLLLLSTLRRLEEDNNNDNLAIEIHKYTMIDKPFWIINEKGIITKMGTIEQKSLSLTGKLKESRTITSSSFPMSNDIRVGQYIDCLNKGDSIYVFTNLYILEHSKVLVLCLNNELIDIDKWYETICYERKLDSCPYCGDSLITFYRSRRYSYLCTNIACIGRLEAALKSLNIKLSDKTKKKICESINPEKEFLKVPEIKTLYTNMAKDVKCLNAYNFRKKYLPRSFNPKVDHKDLDLGIDYLSSLLKQSSESIYTRALFLKLFKNRDKGGVLWDPDWY